MGKSRLSQASSRSGGDKLPTWERDQYRFPNVSTSLEIDAFSHFRQSGCQSERKNINSRMSSTSLEALAVIKLVANGDACVDEDRKKDLEEEREGVCNTSIKWSP